MAQPTDFLSPVQQASQLPQPDVAGAFMAGLQNSLQTQMQQRQVARQVSQQQQLDAARQQFIQNPTATNTRALATLDPQTFAAIKQQHDMQSSDQQKQDLTDGVALAGYLKAGLTDKATALAEQRRDALKAAGQDTAHMDQIISMIQADPKAALGSMNMGLAAILGPDKFGEAFPALETNDRANIELPGKQALTAAQTDEAKATAAKTQAETENLKNPRPETASVVDPVTGEIKYYNRNAAPPAEPLPGDVEALANSIESSENSTGDNGAKNPRSSATGNGQFINSTWLQMVKRFRPDVAKGKSDAEILSLRSDPALSHEMTGQNAVVNASVLASANAGKGLPVVGWTLAMAHKLGPEDAISVMNAAPDTKLTDVLPRKVIAANPQLAKLTAGEYSHQLADRFGQNPINVAAQPGADGALMNADTIAMIGSQYLRFGPDALKNLGAGKNGVMNKNRVLNWSAQMAKEAGTSNPELVARFAENKANMGALEQNTKALTGITSSVNTLDANLDFALSLAKRGLGPTGVPLADMPINKLRSVLGSADAKTLDNVLTTTGDEYARVLSSGPSGAGGATSDSARAEAHKLLNNGMTLNQLIQAAQAARTEGVNRKASYAKENARLVETISGAHTQTAASGPQPPKPGQVVDGYRFKGGNPADQRSWEQVR